MYQLAKTSVGLTGQVKWDLVISNGSVSELQIVPIHKDVAYTYERRNDTTNYTHIQNISRLYNLTHSTFFQPVIDPLLNTGYPIRNKGEWLDTHDCTYEMHLGRAKYQRYNKQFEFFCPIWVDNADDLNNISFRVVVKSANSDSVLYTQNIDLDKHINGSKTIREYFREYAKQTELNKDIAYININKHNSWIKGIDVKNGILQTKNTPTVIDNLISMERPLLDTDALILAQFADNKIVCTQLIKLNFVFNLSDVILPSLVSNFIGSDLNIYVDVYSNGEKVEVVDLYSNYDFIPKYDCGERKITDKNCLDYLSDYRAIEQIYDNRLVQSVFHWALRSNNDYLFNLYNGFSPIYGDDEITGVYTDSPVTTDKQFIPEHNPFTWCITNSIGDIKDYKDDESSAMNVNNKFARRLYNLPLSSMSYITISDKQEFMWLRSLQIDCDKVAKVNNLPKELYVSFVEYKNSSTVETDIDYTKAFSGYENIFKHYTYSKETATVDIVTRTVNGSVAVMFIIKDSDYVDDLSFVKFREQVWDITDEWIKNILTYISSVLKAVVNPNIIHLSQKLVGREITRPKLKKVVREEQLPEIEYIKQPGDVYLLRYDGNITPAFSSSNSTYWVKQYDQQINYKSDKSDIGMSLFNEFTFTKFLPVYPSLCYSSLLYTSLDMSNYYQKKYYNKDHVYNGEISWYKKNKLVCLPTTITIHKEKEGGLTEEEVWELIGDYLEGLGVNKETLSFILPLYTYKMISDYKNNTTTTEYIHTITVNLK